MRKGLIVTAVVLALVVPTLAFAAVVRHHHTARHSTRHSVTHGAKHKARHRAHRASHRTHSSQH
jgi:hypothetical protein